jgi:hypothetical protein
MENANIDKNTFGFVGNSSQLRCFPFGSAKKRINDLLKLTKTQFIGFVYSKTVRRIQYQNCGGVNYEKIRFSQ